MAKQLARTQKERSEETRGKLLEAARKVFVKSGFEAASIDDIATKAGYTRGAFYFNFKSKDELFIAVLEQEINHAHRAIRELGHRHQDAGERLLALNELYTRLGSDLHFVMLVLEFKLYAIRHPRSHARMAEAFARLRKSRENLLGRTLNELGLSVPLRSDLIEMGFWALCSGLALETLFSSALSVVDVRSILTAFSERVLGVESTVRKNGNGKRKLRETTKKSMAEPIRV